MCPLNSRVRHSELSVGLGTFVLSSSSQNTKTLLGSFCGSFCGPDKYQPPFTSPPSTYGHDLKKRAEAAAPNQLLSFPFRWQEREGGRAGRERECAGGI